MNATKRDVSLHYATSRNVPEMVEIDAACDPRPWTEAKFNRLLIRRNTVAMIAYQSFEVVGFLVYELGRDEIEILRMGVAPKHRRRGVGRTLVERLFAKLDHRRRKAVTALVRESLTGTHLFLRNMNFRAVHVHRGWFRDTGEDGYQFEAIAEPLEPFQSS